MGNNPSATSKPATGGPAASAGGATPTSATSTTSAAAFSADYSPSQSQTQSPRNPKRDSKSFPIHAAPRIAAPPESSAIQAQGHTHSSSSRHPNRTSLPPSLAAAVSSSPTTSSNSSTLVGSHNAPSRLLSEATNAKPVVFRDEPTKPVDVPLSHTEASSLAGRAAAAAADLYPGLAADLPLVPHSSITDMSYLTRPPRLPLPIEEEIHTPGSPIIAPTDVADVTPDAADLAGLEDHEVEGEAADSEGMTRKSSALSTTTAAEEEAVEGLIVDRTRPTVPTRLEWSRGGDKVFLTGTIFQWNKKHRLHPVEGMPGHFATTISILPGTHHVRFLVDGIMQTSPDLPTTVDFGGNLVNYIEVNPDDVPAEAAAAPTAEAAAAATPAAAAAAAAAAVQPETAVDADALKTSPSQTDEPPKRGRSVPSPEMYNHQIPQYLVDYDQPEDSPLYQYASTAIDRLPNPPSLPGFLGKPILNAATLIKDDNSVLNMPNHTVLNHLATSSIKNNILAVSATTRYKNKYVTTIIYKPTNEEASPSSSK